MEYIPINKYKIEEIEQYIRRQCKYSKFLKEDENHSLIFELKNEDKQITIEISFYDKLPYGSIKMFTHCYSADESVITSDEIIDMYVFGKEHKRKIKELIKYFRKDKLI